MESNFNFSLESEWQILSIYSFYLFIFFTLWSVGIAKFLSFFFFLLICTRSDLVTGVEWSVFMLKSRRISCISFSGTDSSLYYLSALSNFSRLHNSQWITFPTQSCLFLYSFLCLFAAFAYHVINRFIIIIIIIIIVLILECSHYSLVHFLWPEVTKGVLTVWDQATDNFFFIFKIYADSSFLKILAVLVKTIFRISWRNEFPGILFTDSSWLSKPQQPQNYNTRQHPVVRLKFRISFTGPL